MALLKYKSRGSKVKELQELLNAAGFDAGVPDGIFGKGTERAVKAFQASKGLIADGKVGNMTWQALRNQPIKVYNFDMEIDLVKYPLNDNEYYKEIVVKDTIYLHHTAGGARPDYVIDGWERDKTNRGSVLRVGTAFVIGRKTTGSKDYDGVICSPFDPKYWSHHLGTKRSKYAKFNNARLNAKSIGIEICNYGWLQKDEEGKFYFETAGGKIYVDESEVCILEKPFRGQQYFQKYTKKQLDATKRLILELAKKFDIKLEKRTYDRDWFDLKYDALNGVGGLWTHVNVREDKWDCFPQPELIDMMNSLHDALEAIKKNEPIPTDPVVTDPIVTSDDPVSDPIVTPPIVINPIEVDSTRTDPIIINIPTDSDN